MYPLKGRRVAILLLKIMSDTTTEVIPTGEEVPVMEVGVQTRSAAKECKTCDFCQIKKELTRVNQMITCPTKVVNQRLLDEKNPPRKRKLKETVEKKN
jgi:hypothetical protein